MYKECRYCDNYGEVADPKAKCKCGAERIICPQCKGYSNPILVGRLIDSKLERMEELYKKICTKLGVTA